MTTPNKDNQKIAQLEMTLQKLQESVKLMAQRISFLERENNRRKSDVNQLASSINRKG